MSGARVIVCGSRGWHDRKLIADTLFDVVDKYGWRFPEPTIVHGGARGADRLAADEAGKLGLLVEAHPADWQKHGKKAGPIRNEEMAALGAGLCVAFWDGRSTGTMDMIARAATHRIPVQIVRPAALPGDGPGGTPAAVLPSQKKTPR